MKAIFKTEETTTFKSFVEYQTVLERDTATTL